MEEVEEEVDIATEVETVETGVGDVVETGAWVEEMIVEEMMVVVIETEWGGICVVICGKKLGDLKCNGGDVDCCEE